METKRTVTEFFDREYLEYAKYVVENRAIPNVIDGLKPTQRKVVFVANKIWKTGKEKPMKLFQLGGRVAADAFYHHGNTSLEGAMVTMAQRFKNSLPFATCHFMNSYAGPHTFPVIIDPLAYTHPEDHLGLSNLWEMLPTWLIELRLKSA